MPIQLSNLLLLTSEIPFPEGDVSFDHYEVLFEHFAIHL